jgi:hypothetical protein
VFDFAGWRKVRPWYISGGSGGWQVAWVTETIFKVDKVKFSRLLEIRAIGGALFHKQGNFPTHGFAEVGLEKAGQTMPPELLAGVEFDVVRLFEHEGGEFRRGAVPDGEQQCKWSGPKKEQSHFWG